MTDGGTAAGVFDDRAGEWGAWQESPWGRIRYAIVQETTARAVAALPGRLRVLDVGGGDGSDSLPLAARGHEVTVLDFAPELLAQARHAAATHGLATAVRVVRADLDDLMRGEGLAELGTFDVVLCHNMDLIADDERKADPQFYDQLLELELLLCEREPYWRTARFWQLTARRDG